LVDGERMEKTLRNYGGRTKLGRPDAKQETEKLT